MVDYEESIWWFIENQLYVVLLIELWKEEPRRSPGGLLPDKLNRAELEK